jgi:hypothetical protein
VGGVSLAVGAGWPDVFIEAIFGRSEHLALGLRARYFFGAPWGLFDSASALALELPLSVRLGHWGAWSMELVVAPGVAVAWDRQWAAMDDSLLSDEGQATPVETRLAVGLVNTWRFSPLWAAKLGLIVPARFLFVVTDNELAEPWRFDVPFALSLGIVRQLTDWLSVHVVADVGPSVTHRPTGWSDGAFEVGTEATFYFNSTAGLSFSL